MEIENGERKRSPPRGERNFGNKCTKRAVSDEIPQETKNISPGQDKRVEIQWNLVHIPHNQLSCSAL